MAAAITTLSSLFRWPNNTLIPHKQMGPVVRGAPPEQTQAPEGHGTQDKGQRTVWHFDKLCQ